MDNQQEIFEFLDNLRDSSAHNMMSISPELQAEFGLDRREAKQAVLAWIRSKTETV
tara:strand:- start:8518 stop:8685 length:168 start_codon:yes stop_codon:yes gene_type:complete